MKFTHSLKIIAVLTVLLPSLAFSEDISTNKTDKSFVFHEPKTVSREIKTESFIVTKLLEENHFAKKPITDAIARETLLNYLKALDGAHLIFLQSDVDEILKMAPAVRNGLLKQDLSLPFQIFERFQKRVDERLVLVNEIMKEKFKFDGDDTIVLDREKAAWPKTEEEARDLWKRYIKFQVLQEKLNKEPLNKALDIVKRRIDRQLKSVNEMDASEIVTTYLNALVKNYDPHSEYQSPDAFNEFKISMKLSLTGIGAVLSTEDGYTKIISLSTGGPADRDGRLKPGDKIIGVAQADLEFVDCIDMKLKKVVSMIRGPKGTKVRLRIIPADATDPAQRKIIELIRDEIKIEAQEAKAKLIQWTAQDGKVHKFGVLDLPMFYSDPDDKGENGKSLTKDTRKLLDELNKQGVEGVIVDLRRNGGGDLKEAIKLTGLFVTNGPVVQVKDEKGNIEVFEDTDKNVQYSGPLIVLTSHGSASASEIFAAALQDYNRALMVGEKSTFGKGTVQALIELKRFYQTNDSGAMKMTVQKFYRIAGGSTQLKGVIPDVQLPSLFDVLDIAEKSLDSPLPYDEIPSTKFSNYNNMNPGITDQLSKKSLARIEKNPDYKYILEDIKIQESRPKDRPISLNEKTRMDEKNADKARIEARKKERLARKTMNVKVLQMTVDKPVPHEIPPEEIAKKKKEREAARDKNGEDDPFEDMPEIDPALDESYNILFDYIQTTQKNEA
ncbi:MAG: carboxy terminal-processing peptidase [Verrucomicrobiota bacterium]|nr:carboxy terminal-processing peptidase [Verrucomicrobiota bacterium]